MNKEKLINNREKRDIQFSPPDISQLEIDMVVNTLRSGWITTGSQVREFEKRLAAFVDADDCACLSSQTAAAEMVLRLLGIGACSESLDGSYGSSDDEVITCAYTYTATASVVLHTGAKLVLVDCVKDGCEIDYDAIEAAITPNTKAVIPIDLGGVPCDYDRIFEIVKSKSQLFRPANKLQAAIGRVAVIADSAHALGAITTVGGKAEKIGSVADFSNFSFHAVKNLTTAEGGAVTWRTVSGISNEDIHKHIRLYSLHGQDKDSFEKNVLGSWEYDIVGAWYKCNMTDVMASMGLAQLERYPGLLLRRREIIEKYDAAFEPAGIRVLKHFSPDKTSSGHLYLTGIPGSDREYANKVMHKLAERGIATNVHYKPLPMHTAYKKLGFRIEDFPNAYDYFKNEISLPLHTRLSDEDVEYIIDVYLSIVKQ